MGTCSSHCIGYANPKGKKKAPRFLYLSVNGKVAAELRVEEVAPEPACQISSRLRGDPSAAGRPTGTHWLGSDGSMTKAAETTVTAQWSE